MLFLNADHVRQALPMPLAISTMKQAFAALSDGRATVPPRAHLPLTRNRGISLIMPAWLDDPAVERQALAVKVVSLFDGNKARGLARIQAVVMVMEPDTGRPLAVLEGATLTAIRTAAASGAATDLLARAESRVVALLGAGVQARAHLEAMCAVRNIEEVRVFSRTAESARRFVNEAVAKGGSSPKLVVAGSAREALCAADIICCTTTSPTPVFVDGDLSSGAHVNAVGSYTPQAAEVPAETVCRAKVVVDSRAAAWEEAGDLIQPNVSGLFQRDQIHADLGELVLGRATGRTSETGITFFKSVGIAVQDAAAANAVLQNARRMGLGQEIPW